MPTAERQVAANVRRYSRRARSYARRHGEIFNEVERQRLRASLGAALEMTGREPSSITVLDFGCGSGNVTAQLLALGVKVVAADVSPEFLRMIRTAFPRTEVDTHLLNGRDLNGVASESFDMVATYSVLHHVPDYLAIVDEFCRVVAPGGVIYIDHEAAPRVWEHDAGLAEYRAAVSASETASLSRFVSRDYITRQMRREWRHVKRWLLRDGRYWEEGDLHVWPDDHIEWRSIDDTLRGAGCRIEMVEDYLVHRSGVSSALYEQYRKTAADMRVLAARKCGGEHSERDT